ncbi:site-specific integrase [Shewanella algae]|uniref:site-specific integrase n=1 Tax=Shewanella algae TaxID=38313 RepID=UPI001AAD348B|nr:site-specific integrase [Shewanella algae]QTE96363.1 tyrosine-type recombinase/integrase [Shewanella algae]
MASSTPTYLYQRNEIWWYRQRLPKPFINITVRLSLGTTDRYLASFISMMLAQCLRDKVLRLVQLTKAAGYVPEKDKATETLIHEVLRLSFDMSMKNRHFKNCEESRMDSCTKKLVTSYAQAIIRHCHQLELSAWQSQVRTEAEYVEWIEQLHLFKSQTTEAAYLNDLRQSKRLVNEYFEDTQSTKPNDEQLNIITRMVCDRIPDVFQSLMEHRSPDALGTMVVSPQEPGSVPKAGTEPGSVKAISELFEEWPDKPLLEVIQEYLSEHELKGWKKKTTKQYEHTLFIASHYFGKQNIARLTRAQGRDLRSTLLKLIKGKTQANIANEGLATCLTDDQALRVSTTTANNHMNRLREFFRWAVSMGYLKSNPMPDDNLPAPRVSKQAKRDPIKDEEAKIVFSQPLYSELIGFRKLKSRKIENASHFWLPLIAAYSGMRVGEIAQLYVCDIKKIKEVWCFVVQQTTEHHFLKTPNAVRAIPIHKELIRLGLLQFVDYIRQRGGERLFNNYTLEKGKYNDKAGQWYRDHFRSDIGIRNDATLHGYRHSVKDKLSRMTVNPEHVARLIGHAASQYGGLIPDDVSHLVPLINGIDYDGATAHIHQIAPDIFHNDPAAVVSEEESA